MTFVETPVATNGDPVAPEGFQRDVGCADGPGQDRRVDHVGEDPCVGEEAGAFAGLGLAQLGEVAVVPARELVSGVPFALAVAQQDQRGHGVLEPWDRRAGQRYPTGVIGPCQDFGSNVAKLRLKILECPLTQKGGATAGNP